MKADRSRKCGGAIRYLFTERAHLMCPHMCFGIVAAAAGPYDAERIRDTLDRLGAAHPFLNALLGYEAGKNAYYYEITDCLRAELRLNDREIRRVDDPAVMEEYRRLTGYEWNLFEEGMLKVSAWRMGERTCFLLVFHHLLADGRGALGLARELAECYASGTAPKAVPEQLIASADDLPGDSRLPFVSRMLVKKANRDFGKEQRIISYAEYRTFADGFVKEDAVVHTVTRTRHEEMTGIAGQCRNHGVTVNDWLLARMMLEENTGKVIMACDLREQLGVYREGALGNYSTAFSIEARAKGKELYALAKEIHDSVRRKMDRPAELLLVLRCYADLNPGILDAAMISCRGGFPSKTGKFIGSMFFGFAAGNGHSVTNLGRIESDSMPEAFFIPPASPAIRKTWGVLTVNGTMTICTSERQAGEQNAPAS